MWYVYMSVASIFFYSYFILSTEKGIVVFEVPHEFRLSLSVVGDDLKLPWRLVNLEVLVGVGLPGGPPLCHSQQTRYLTQLAQSHLVAAEYPLTHVFTLLHTFCLSLVLDCLHTQVYTVYIIIVEHLSKDPRNEDTSPFLSNKPPE